MSLQDWVSPLDRLRLPHNVMDRLDALERDTISALEQNIQVGSLEEFSGNGGALNSGTLVIGTIICPCADTVDIISSPYTGMIFVAPAIRLNVTDPLG